MREPLRRHQPAARAVPRHLLEGIPGEARALLTPPDKPGWMSDVAATTVRVLARDRVFEDDASYLAWSFKVSGEVFEKPAYRMLMYVLSPTLVAMGAARRWHTFRRGSDLDARVDKGSGTLVVTFPEHLYPEIVQRSFGETFRAALTAAKAKQLSVTVTETSATKATYQIRWS